MNCDQGYKLYLKVRWIKFESEDCDATVICDYKSAIDMIKSLYKLEDRVRISRISESYTFRIGVGMNQCNLKVKTNAIITRNLRIPQYPYKQSSRRWSSGIFGWFQDMESCYGTRFCLECYLCCLNTRYEEACCASWIQPRSTLALRVQHRNRFGIEGSIGGDCCASLRRDMDNLSTYRATFSRKELKRDVMITVVRINTDVVRMIVQLASHRNILSDELLNKSFVNTICLSNQNIGSRAWLLKIHGKKEIFTSKILVLWAPREEEE